MAATPGRSLKDRIRALFRKRRQTRLINAFIDNLHQKVEERQKVHHIHLSSNNTPSSHTTPATSAFTEREYPGQQGHTHLSTHPYNPSSALFPCLWPPSNYALPQASRDNLPTIPHVYNNQSTLDNISRRDRYTETNFQPVLNLKFDHDFNIKTRFVSDENTKVPHYYNALGISFLKSDDIGLDNPLIKNAYDKELLANDISNGQLLSAGCSRVLGNIELQTTARFTKKIDVSTTADNNTSEGKKDMWSQTCAELNDEVKLCDKCVTLQLKDSIIEVILLKNDITGISDERKEEENVLVDIKGTDCGQSEEQIYINGQRVHTVSIVANNIFVNINMGAADNICCETATNVEKAERRRDKDEIMNKSTSEMSSYNVKNINVDSTTEMCCEIKNINVDKEVETSDDVRRIIINTPEIRYCVGKKINVDTAVERSCDIQNINADTAVERSCDIQNINADTAVERSCDIQNINVDTDIERSCDIQNIYVDTAEERSCNIQNINVDTAVERSCNIKNINVDTAVEKSCDIQNINVDTAVEKSCDIQNINADTAVERSCNIQNIFTDMGFSCESKNIKTVTAEVQVCDGEGINADLPGEHSFDETTINVGISREESSQYKNITSSLNKHNMKAPAASFNSTLQDHSQKTLHFTNIHQSDYVLSDKWNQQREIEKVEIPRNAIHGYHLPLPLAPSEDSGIVKSEDMLVLFKNIPLETVEKQSIISYQISHKSSDFCDDGYRDRSDKLIGSRFNEQSVTTAQIERCRSNKEDKANGGWTDVSEYCDGAINGNIKGFAETPLSGDMTQASTLSLTLVDGQNVNVVVDECGLVDVYQLVQNTDSQDPNVIKRGMDYKSPAIKIERLLHHLDQVKKERQEGKRQLRDVNKIMWALTKEASDFRTTLAEVCDNSVMVIGGNVSAKSLEPNCYKRYTNIKTLSDATKALMVVRNHIRALNDLEILIYRQHLVLLQVFPNDNHIQAPPPKRLNRPTHKVTKTKRSEQPINGHTEIGSIVIEIVSSVPEQNSWSKEISQTDSPITISTLLSISNEGTASSQLLTDTEV